MGEQERKLAAEKEPALAVAILAGIRDALQIDEKQTVSEFMKKEIILQKDTVLATIHTEKGLSYFLGNNEGVTIGNLEKILGHYMVNIPTTINMIKMQAAQDAAKEKPKLFVPGDNGKNRIGGV